jgi:hypothetical protein
MENIAHEVKPIIRLVTKSDRVGSRPCLFIKNMAADTYSRKKSGTSNSREMDSYLGGS